VERGHPPAASTRLHHSTRHQATVHETLPVRLSDDGRTATWNPGLTFASRVLVRVVREDGAVEERPTMNSGRARVREGERIAAVLAEEPPRR
jgi:hypothetical protein